MVRRFGPRYQVKLYLQSIYPPLILHFLKIGPVFQGIALRRKGLGDMHKVDPLRCSNSRIPKKVESGIDSLWEVLFFHESDGVKLLSHSVLTEINWASPTLSIHIPKQSCCNPFF